MWEMSLDQRYRMIAIDLDGTLLSPRGHVTERTKSAIHKCLSAGLLVCFATGRNWTESKTVLDAVAHYDTAVFAGGALVVDTGHRVTLHRTMMQPDLAREVCSFFESRNHAAMALQDTLVAGIDYLLSDGVELDESTAAWMRISKAALHRVPDLSSHSHEHTIRVGIVATPESAAQMETELNEQFGERIVLPCLPDAALPVLLDDTCPGHAPNAAISRPVPAATIHHPRSAASGSDGCHCSSQAPAAKPRMNPRMLDRA